MNDIIVYRDQEDRPWISFTGEYMQRLCADPDAKLLVIDRILWRESLAECGVVLREVWRSGATS